MGYQFIYDVTATHCVTSYESSLRAAFDEAETAENEQDYGDAEYVESQLHVINDENGKELWNSDDSELSAEEFIAAYAAGKEARDG